jgi:EmrB/QacA subfamily drug resistance transporter
MTTSAPDRLDPRTLVVAAVVVIGTIMVILDTTIVNVALERLSRDFGAPLDGVQWVVTAYLLALACVIPLTGWATERFDTKRVWLSAVGLFAGGSALCATAWSLESLVAFRVLQGLGGGLLMPVGTVIIARAAGPGRLGRVMSVLGVPMLLGPVLGPVLGGLLVERAGWEWIFVINVPIGLVALALGARLLPPAGGERRPMSLDLRGLALLSPGLALLTFGLSELSGAGASAPSFYGPVAGGLLLVAGFCLEARRAEHPLIDLRLFRSSAFSAGAAATLLVGAALFGGLLLLPLYFQVARGESPLSAGLLLAPQGIGAALAMPLSGQLTDRVGGGRVAVVGLSIIGLATLVFTQLRPETSLPLLGAALLVRGIGLGATTMPVMAAAYATLSPDQIPAATTALNVVQRIGGSLGTAVLSVILQHEVTARVGPLAATPAATGGPPHGVPPHAAHGLAAAFSAAFAWSVAVTLIALPAAALLARASGRRSPLRPPAIGGAPASSSPPVRGRVSSPPAQSDTVAGRLSIARVPGNLASPPGERLSQRRCLLSVSAARHGTRNHRLEQENEP